MATKHLATWAVNLTPTSLPPAVLHATQRSLYNYLGCALAGSSHPTVSKASSALLPFSGPATSTLFGHRGGPPSTDAQHAALLNGIASHVHDYDDTHLATIIHPTGPVASALLALIQHLSLTRGNPIPGPELLCALVAGIETSCKLGLAVWPSHYDVGWHITGTTGSVGAAVAAGKVLGLDGGRMAHAIGLAATQVTGLREMFGSDTKAFHPGRAAQNGMVAALLAEKGYTSSEKGLEALRGWGNVVVAGGRPELERYLGELGERWEVGRNAFKPFPCGIVAHPAIDGCVRANRRMGEWGLKGEEVVRVGVRVHPLVMELMAKRAPRDGLEAKFSVFHGSAVGLLYGKAGMAQYADEVVTSDEVVAVRDRIEAEVDGGLETDEAYVTVHFKDGRKFEAHVEHAIGSLENPMTDELLTEKFIDQSALVIGQDAQKASDIAWKIGEAEDVAKVLQQL